MSTKIIIPTTLRRLRSRQSTARRQPKRVTD